MGVEWQCVVVARCTVAEPVSCVGGDDDASGERRAGPVAKLQGSTIVSTVCGGRALFNLSLLSKDTREGASAIGLPSASWGPAERIPNAAPHSRRTKSRAAALRVGMARSHAACSQQPAAHSSARSAQLRIQLHRQRDARIKRQKELLSLFLICFKKRHYVQQINCNRSNQLQQIGCKTDQSETGGAHRHSGRTASAIPANLIEMPVGSVLASDSRVIGCWVGCP